LESRLLNACWSYHMKSSSMSMSSRCIWNK
jgi:hypothetical protein